MKDLVDITIESGSGGEGLIAFDSWRKATGGNGGKGGDVYVVGSTNYFDFSHLEKHSSLKAENGERGEKNKRNGKNGKDLTLYVPLVTKIFNPDGSEVITLYNDGDKVKLLEGGEGGLGNYTLRGEGWDGKLSRKRALKGESKSFKLELNLRADAIFLGYPNAGKSSIINALTNAKYKVAEYEFTTLDPQLAVMGHYILMDLPGLIEGACDGKGLGTKFLKHTKYSKLLVHCISLENSDLKSTYLKMREEFKSISKELEMMKEFVVFTKADILSLEDLEILKKKLKKEFNDFLVISVYRDEDLKLLREELKERLSSTPDTTV